MIIRPNLTLLTGAALSLVAGAAIYGAVTTANAVTSISLTSPVKASVATAPAGAARCAAGQELEDGICVLHSRNNADGAASAATPAAPAGAAGCAADLELEDGACVPHSRNSAGRSASSEDDAEDATDHRGSDDSVRDDSGRDDGGRDDSGRDDGVRSGDDNRSGHSSDH
jgi:hypothetical protein